MEKYILLIYRSAPFTLFRVNYVENCKMSYSGRPKRDNIANL